MTGGMDADALLSRNAEILQLLDAATRARGDGAPTERERVLAAEAEANIAALASAAPPGALMPGCSTSAPSGDSSSGAVPFKTFVDVARAEGLLRLPCDVPPRAHAAPITNGRTGLPGVPPLSMVSGVDDVDDDVPGYVPRAADGTAFRKDEATGRLYYDGPNGEIPRGDARVTYFALASGPPAGFQWHLVPGINTRLRAREEVKFYTRADVVSQDPLDGGAVFRFDVRRPKLGHGVSFNIGAGPDGTPLLSYSSLRALYELPDGSKWCEHVDYYDLDDVRQTARAVGHKVWRRTVLLPDHDEERELVRVRGWRHTRMSKCEYESWIYTGEEYNREAQSGGLVDKEAFYWRVGFDPETIRQVEVSD